VRPHRWRATTVGTRLAAAILGVALACAAVALGLNYLLVRDALLEASPDVEALDADQPAAGPPDVLEELDRSVRDDTLRTLATRSLVSLAVTFAAGLVVSRMLARRALRPIDAISAVIDECSEHDLSRRVDVREPDDELARLSRTVNRTLSRLEEGFERQRLFVANASHELRTPLTLIRSSADVALNRRDPSDDDHRNALSTIEAAARRTQALLDRLLALARLDRRGIGSGLVALDEIALAALDHVAVEVGNPHGVRVDRDVAPAPAVGDGPLIEAAVRNLIDNAHRHNIRGGRVELSTGTGGAESWVRVVNTGERIDEDATDVLLQPFTRRSPSTSGTGLGLAIAARIAAVHGGELTISSRDGGGLDARLTLPAPDPAPT
jgi:signal transduction histidine kinase